jgi:hypothetical protein
MQDALRRPDVVMRVLFTLDEQRALQEANAEMSTPPLSRELQLPPVVTVLGPLDESDVQSTAQQIKVRIRTPSGNPATALRATVRWALGQSRRYTQELPATPAPPGRDAEVEAAVAVTLPAEDSTVLLQAEVGAVASEPVLLRLRWRGPAGLSTESRPDLFILSVGVSEYQDERLRLEYPAKDARDIAAALLKQKGKLYGGVTARTITDRDATRERILAELGWLRRSATANDVAIILLAGHGARDPVSGRYSFYPFEANPAEPGRTLLPAPELRAALNSIEGKVVLLLDTCHAGNVVERNGAATGRDLERFVNQTASVESNIVVYTASTGGQAARESPKWKNGAFTKALLEGPRGKADPAGSGMVTVSKLETYVGDRVRELTGDLQTPATAKPVSTVDYALAKVPKPVYRQWWFWSSLSLAAGITVTGVLLGTRPWEPSPPVLEF